MVSRKEIIKEIMKTIKFVIYETRKIILIKIKLKLTTIKIFKNLKIVLTNSFWEKNLLTT